MHILVDEQRDLPAILIGAVLLYINFDKSWELSAHNWEPGIERIFNVK